jgi:hypothetical protein
MLLSHHHNAGQNLDIKIANRSFENMSQFKYLEMTVANENLIRRKLRGDSDNACYHSVQYHLPSCLPSNIKIRIYKTIIMPVVL